jgi:hypothetical protein
MGFFGKLFGNTTKMPAFPDDWTLASMVATHIDGVIQTEGLKAILEPTIAVILTHRYAVRVQWSPGLKIEKDIISFAYLKQFHELQRIKSSFGLDIAKDLPPKEARQIMQMMGDSIGQQAIDRLSIAVAKELRRKIRPAEDA